LSQETPADRSTATESTIGGYAAFHYQDFRRFILGRALGYSAHQVLLVAVGYQIYDQTGDAISLAFLNLAIVLPVILCFPYTGYVADHFDRGKVIVTGYSLTAAAVGLLAVLTALDQPVSWIHYVLLFGIGGARAFYAPTSNAVVPNLVPTPVLSNAIAWNSSIAKTTQICGPAAGGFLYLLGPEFVYGTIVVAFLIGLLATSMVTHRGAASKKGPADFRSLFGGFRYVWERRIVLGAMAVDFLTMLMGTLPTMLPIFAKDILDVGPAGAGILRSAIAGGGLVAALWLAHSSIGGQAGAKMLWAAALFGVSIIVFGLSTHFLLSVVALAAVGVSEALNVNIRHTILQIATPDSMRGRVSAVNSLSSNSGSELGGFRAGLFTAWMGPVEAVVVGGIAVLLVALGSFKTFPELAKVDRLDRLLDEPGVKGVAS
jgi:MFS family permease